MKNLQYRHCDKPRLHHCKLNTEERRGFSLIELLISLIVISLITTAFAPVLTKRLKNQNATISNGARVEDCLKFDNRCLLCMSGKCSLCSTQINLEEGKYVDASLSCDIKNCDTGCTKCNSTECTSCASDYTLIDGKCKETKGCLAIGNICVAKFNAGDTYLGGLEIPDGIGVTKKVPAASASSGGSHTEAYCWIGNGQFSTVADCNADNGGYSGCTRTVCTWSAADKICKYHGWRLPTQSEIAQFASYSIGLGTGGLQLCDDYSGYSSAQCLRAPRCSGSYYGYCYPHDVWSSQVSGSSAYGYNLDQGSWPGPNSRDQSYAFSVRCVRDL